MNLNTYTLSPLSSLEASFLVCAWEPDPLWACSGGCNEVGGQQIEGRAGTSL